jgi:YidC/Oxa1 family membrane protein insertase
MMAMQRAQPEIKKLQAKYKNDRAKLNEEMMAFYKENKINPLAGCLPLVVQLPIFLALFRVMREPYKHVPKSSDLYAAFCTSHGQLHMKACNLPNAHPPLPRPQYFLGMDLSQHATAVTGGFLDALPYFILVGLVVVTGFAQARQSRRNAPNMNSQMAMITSILPIGFGLFSLQFPAGLVLYFLVSNLWRLGQQELIMRKITRPGQAAIASSATKDDAIEVEGTDTDTSAFPRAAGGLRKLFQLPAASNGGADAGAPNGANGANGAPKPTADRPAGKQSGAAGKNAPAKGAPAKGAPAKGATKGTAAKGGTASGAGASAGAPSGSSRRRNNKKRKRR